MKLRERIARALAVADGKDPDAPAWMRIPGSHPEGLCWADQYGRKADAILSILTDPDDETVERVAAKQFPKAKAAWDELLDFGAQQGWSREDALAYADRAHKSYAPEYDWHLARETTRSIIRAALSSLGEG